ncbi:MAG: viroplasmin family protein [Lewinellaceae bacterium]|nr:viroplasmin family protein [Lewinellaceae bacterium]
MTKAKKFYVVWVGASPGIYDNWADCHAQVRGFPKARYQSFTSRMEAESAFRKGAPPVKPKTSPATPKAQSSSSGIIWASISVDAACSGNPGRLEYQGVETRTGKRLFHQAFPLGTNNIGEFLAIVHGLGYLQKQGLNLPIYSDSVNAMKWVRQKKCKTTLPENSQTKELFELIRRAESWLQQNRYDNLLLKWETDKWGEIPADFGRK